MRKSPQEKKWEVEDAAKTLLRAEEIKGNKQLHSAAKKELSKQAQKIQKVVKKR